MKTDKRTDKCRCWTPACKECLRFKTEKSGTGYSSACSIKEKNRDPKTLIEKLKALFY